MTDATPPAGFARHFRLSPVTDAWEPLWSRRDADRLTIGLFVAECHCNARGRLHGGVLTTLADNAMGLACALALGDAGMVTVNLCVDFFGGAAPGQWIEIAATPSRTGRTIAFASAVVTADGEPIARASAVFRTIIKEAT